MHAENVSGRQIECFQNVGGGYIYDVLTFQKSRGGHSSIQYSLGGQEHT